jgi:tetratricopeptide (TPR) repeat protein
MKRKSSSFAIVIGVFLLVGIVVCIIWITTVVVNSNLAETFFSSGNEKYTKKDYQGAIADYSEVIRLKPDNAEAFQNRGNAKSELGDKQGAIADYSQFIRSNPDDADAHYRRGLIRQEIGEMQEALADFRRAAALFQQQGNSEWYNKSLIKIRELGG